MKPAFGGMDGGKTYQQMATAVNQKLAANSLSTPTPASAKKMTKSTPTESSSTPGEGEAKLYARIAQLEVPPLSTLVCT